MIKNEKSDRSYSIIFMGVLDTIRIDFGRVSDTHKAYGSWSPGHLAGVSGGVPILVDSRCSHSYINGGEQCFQFRS